MPLHVVCSETNERKTTNVGSGWRAFSTRENLSKKAEFSLLFLGSGFETEAVPLPPIRIPTREKRKLMIMRSKEKTRESFIRALCISILCLFFCPSLGSDRAFSLFLLHGLSLSLSLCPTMFSLL